MTSSDSTNKRRCMERQKGDALDAVGVHGTQLPLRRHLRPLLRQREAVEIERRGRALLRRDHGDVHSHGAPVPGVAGVVEPPGQHRRRHSAHSASRVVADRRRSDGVLRLLRDRRDRHHVVRHRVRVVVERATPTGPGGVGSERVATSPLLTLRFRKPRMARRSPVLEAGFSRLSGEFGGKSVANSTTLDGDRRTQRHADFGQAPSTGRHEREVTDAGC